MLLIEENINDNVLYNFCLDFMWVFLDVIIIVNFFNFF